MYKILAAVSLVIILTTSVYSQTNAIFGSSLDSSSNFGSGINKLFSSHSINLGKSRGKIFTLFPFEKISLSKLTSLSQLRQAMPISYAFGFSNNPQNDFRYQQISTVETQPHSNFFGGGFSQLTILSMMNDFIGQGIFGWMSYHHGLMILPHPIGSTSTVIPSPKVLNMTNNNSTKLIKEK
ncbi:MAG TPA: hypothetical protein VIY08_11990 [Candidatus Nitrosocosmicus sp.]